MALAFRPTFWPTVFTIPAVLLMLALGTWQVQRLHWKEGLIAERVERTTAAPIPFPKPGDDLRNLEFRRTVAMGTFLHDQELYIGARSLNEVPGFWVMTPLRLEDGRVVLVNRGWVPSDRKDPAKRPEGQIPGMVKVDGIIRLSTMKGWFTPDNRPDINFWFWIDLPAMAAHAGVADKLVPFYLEAGPAPNPGGLPVGGQTRINLPNDHLQYAITWYALAIALTAVYIVYHRRREDERRRKV